MKRIVYVGHVNVDVVMLKEQGTCTCPPRIKVSVYWLVENMHLWNKL